MDVSEKYERFTEEQMEALERLYHECPKPSSIRLQQLIWEAPVLASIEPKQIKVWFQNRRRYLFILQSSNSWTCRHRLHLIQNVHTDSKLWV
jgi:hypothetical protein